VRVTLSVFVSLSVCVCVSLSVCVCVCVSHCVCVCLSLVCGSLQLSHPYMTTGKTIALTRRTFVGKVMSLLLNMLSRLVITFLPKSRHLLISWLQSPSAVILEPPKIKSDTVSTVPDELWNEVHDIVQETGIKIIPMEKKCKKAK